MRWTSPAVPTDSQNFGGMTQEEKFQSLAVIPGEAVCERQGVGAKWFKNLISVLCLQRDQRHRETKSSL